MRNPVEPTVAAADRRTAFMILAVTLAALVATAAGLYAWRAPRLGIGPTSTDATPPARLAAADAATTTWRVPAPAVVAVRLAPALVAVPVVDPPDWTALALGVAPADAATAPAFAIAPAAAPAEPVITLTSRERRALIASAREPEGEPSPAGYRPGIAVIVPGGSNSDGICR